MKTLKAGDSFPRFCLQVDMKNLVLSERLSAAAKYIQQDSAVADIGTDHGYIPVYLALNKRARLIIAADVKKGPLLHARSSAEEYGVGDRIEFVQTDGLEGLEGRGLDTVVIAGMGGETIATILGKAPWTKAQNVRLILQPQTKLSVLTDWLHNSGCEIKDASLALGDGRIYTIILAGAGENGTRGALLPLLAAKKEPLLPQYLEHEITKIGRALDGLRKSSGAAGDTQALIMRELDELRRLKEETDQWQK